MIVHILYEKPKHRSLSNLFHACLCGKSLQPCLTLWDLMDGSLTGSVHGILQVRTLKWVAILSSRGIFLTQGWNSGILWFHIAGGIFTSEPPGKPTSSISNS